MGMIVKVGEGVNVGAVVGVSGTREGEGEGVEDGSAVGVNVGGGSVSLLQAVRNIAMIIKRGRRSMRTL